MGFCSERAAAGLGPNSETGTVNIYRFGLKHKKSDTIFFFFILTFLVISKTYNPSTKTNDNAVLFFLGAATVVLVLAVLDPKI